MVDRTVIQRVKRQRDARVNEGWFEIRVWVPTEADAEDVRKLAAERRAKAEALHGLKEGVTSMNATNETRILLAVADQGSSAYTTESGAVLTLLTDLAQEGDLTGFSHAFTIFARAKPANAAFVANATPAKVLNGYFLNHQHIDASAFLQWEKANGTWSDAIRDALRDPERFKRVVEDMAAAIGNTVSKHPEGCAAAMNLEAE
jgi:hypothetical protein